MKLLFLLPSFLLCLTAFTQKLSDTTLLQPIEVNSVRASDKMPVAKTNLSKEQVEKQNIGQDLPFIINQTPSVVVNADAGNGIGYTGLRIRGSDATRINITLNGIPYNDAESQGSFFVNIPDIASSASSIQVQRGVGTSSNGAGAFGGSININTNDIVTVKGLEFSNTAGSYASFKNTLAAHSGLIKKHFTADARISNIRSDGYIDRARSRLQSAFGSLAYITSQTNVRLNIFTGKEKTYQAWNGIDEETLKTNRTFNSSGTEKPGEPYSNETDNYTQTHYQLFINQKLSNKLTANLAGFLTKGEGYYEQYKAGESLEDYGLPPYIDGSVTIEETDLVRRLWLDNSFYGSIFSLQYKNDKTEIITGGGINRYEGRHFGEIIWAMVQPAVPAGYKWYDHPAKKTDASGYVKWTQSLSKQFISFLDLQVRNVNYKINGFRYNPQISFNESWTFFNPKGGFRYLKNNFSTYITYGRAAKEPNRDDFEAGTTQVPRPEILNDLELGVEKKSKNYSWGANLYYMWYKDQLILTGKINDVGAYTRTNIEKSYRAGIELTGSASPLNWFSMNATLSLSRNKLSDFTEFIDDYDNGGQQTKFYREPTIAFSPSVVGGLALNFKPVNNTEINLVGKYVSRQYLDNTENINRSLDGYYTQDVRASYIFKRSKIKEVLFFLQVNNLFSKKYEPNGYTFSYISGGSLNTENYYFPMAPVNLTIGINMKL